MTLMDVIVEGADSSKDTYDESAEPPLKKPKVESNLEKFLEVCKIFI